MEDSKLLTQEEFDKLANWLYDFKHKLIDIDNDLHQVRLNNPNSELSIDIDSRKFYDNLNLYLENYYRTDIIKKRRQGTDINDITRFVNIVFEYFKMKYNME